MKILWIMRQLMFWGIIQRRSNQMWKGQLLVINGLEVPISLNRIFEIHCKSIANSRSKAFVRVKLCFLWSISILYDSVTFFFLSITKHHSWWDLVFHMNLKNTLLLAWFSFTSVHIYHDSYYSSDKSYQEPGKDRDKPQKPNCATVFFDSAHFKPKALFYLLR